MCRSSSAAPIHVDGRLLHVGCTQQNSPAARIPWSFATTVIVSPHALKFATPDRLLPQCQQMSVRLRGKIMAVSVTLEIGCFLKVAV